MRYAPRLVAPLSSEKYWIHESAGGYNKCIKVNGNSCLPNCVGYAWGRWYELLGAEPKLSRANAEDWWAYNDGYARGSEPRVGAVICWRKGAVRNSADGAGHVAIVEKVLSNGDIVISQSGYIKPTTTKFNANFKKLTLKKSNNYYFASGYTLQGFIYLPITYNESDKPQLPAIYVKKGTVDLNAMKLQQCLNYFGAKLDEDSNFGSKSLTALKNWQAKNGLVADGCYGPASRDKMRALLG